MSTYALLVISVICMYSIRYTSSITITPSQPLLQKDKERLSKIFELALSTRQDVSSWYSSVQGYHLLGLKQFPKVEPVCQAFGDILHAAIKAPSVDQVNFSNDDIFYAIYGSELLKDCAKFPYWPTANQLNNLGEKLSKKVSTLNDKSDLKLYQNLIRSLIVLKQKVATDKVLTDLTAVIKKDTTVNALLPIFQIVSVLPNVPKTKIKVFFDLIEDAVLQTDEADGKYVYYEQGLIVTSNMVDAIYTLSTKYGELPKIPDEKLLKLTNFLLSRRYTYMPQAAASLITALKTLSQNGHTVPACIFVKNHVIESDATPLTVSVTNVWNEPITGTFKLTKVNQDSASNIKSTGGNALDKEEVDLTYNDKTKLHELNILQLVRKNNKDAQATIHGFYTAHISLKVQPVDKKKASGVRYVGIKSGREIDFKIMSSNVKVSTVRVNLDEADASQIDSASAGTTGGGSHSSSFTLENVKDRVPHVLNVDTLSKLRVRANIAQIIDSVSMPFVPHQTFFRLRHTGNQREIVLIMTMTRTKEDDHKKVYTVKVILDPKNQAKDFAYESGVYDMELIVGDALMTKSIRWLLGSVALKFPPKPVLSPAAQAAKVQWADAPRTPEHSMLPRIEHMFRVPDKRASKSVALLFTALCAVPFFIMIILWLALGVNVNGISDTFISSFLFHIGLSSIFVLYGMYWLYLNMFTTLTYAFILGSVTFLCGNSMLRGLASKRLNVCNNLSTNHE